MMSTQMRIGLVGCGRWGKFILRDLVAQGCRVDVVAVGADSVRNAVEHDANKVVASLAALDAGLDGYVVAVPTVHHADVVNALIPRQRPIFVEKPLTNDPASAHQIARTAFGQVFVMDKWRYHPGVNLIAGLIQSRELGQLRSVQLRRLQWGSPHADVDPVWILLPHDLSIVLHLLGEIPEPRFASGLHEKGWMTSLSVHLGGTVPVAIEVSGQSMSRERLLAATFAQGAVMMSDPMADHILIQHGTGRESGCKPLEKRHIDTRLPLYLELQSFVNHLRGGPPPLSSAADGAQVVERVAQCRALAGLAHRPGGLEPTFFN